VSGVLAGFAATAFLFLREKLPQYQDGNHDGGGAGEYFAHGSGIKR